MLIGVTFRQEALFLSVKQETSSKKTELQFSLCVAKEPRGPHSKITFPEQRRAGSAACQMWLCVVVCRGNSFVKRREGGGGWICTIFSNGRTVE